MSDKSRIVLTALTHALALGAGWAVFAWGKAADANAQAHSTAHSPSTKSTQREHNTADRAALEKEANELIAKILKDQEQNPIFASREQASGDSPPREISKELREAIDKVVVPDDIGKSLQAFLDQIKDTGKNTQEQYLEAYALGYHWMARDPKGFMAWAEGDSARANFLEGIMIEMGPEWYRRLGAEAVMKAALAGKEPSTQMLMDLANNASSHLDAAGLALGKTLLPEDMWEFFSRSAGMNWPSSKSDELVKYAVGSNMPELLVGHKAGTPEHGRFLMKITEEIYDPPGFRDYLLGHPMAREAFLADPTMSLVLRELSAPPSSIAMMDVTRLLNGERDLLYAFRTGQMNAQQMWEAVAAGTPELAFEYPGELREHLFRELSEDNAAEAMKLLKEMPPAERYELALLTSRTHFNDVEPPKFLELLEQVPSDTPELWEGRLDAWNRRGFTNHERLQDGYVEWVQELPPGLDREMALYSLARAVDASNPQLAKDLRAQVSNAELQHRIAQHR